MKQKHAANYSWFLRCDAYVDQGRYVDENGSKVPVGYKCSREAKRELPDKMLICDWCNEHRSRIEFHQPWGIDYQVQLLDEIFKRDMTLLKGLLK